MTETQNDVAELTADDWLGRAAAAAGVTLSKYPMRLLDLLDAEAHATRFVAFVRAAGDVPGESLYRWAAAKGLHPLPADGYDKVSPELRLFFDGFVATVKALAPIVDPPRPAAGTVLHPGQARVDVEDTILRKYGAPGERTHQGLAAGTPTTTAGLRITPYHPAPGQAPAAVVAMQDDQRLYDQTEPRPIVVTPDMLTRMERGNPPSSAEFMAMTPEQRRPYAALFGLPGIEAVTKEPPPAAPDVETLEPRQVSEQIAGPKIGETELVEGVVAVGKTKGKK